MTVEEREEFVRLVYQIAEVVPTMTAVHDCSDESDNRILEVAVNGRADVIGSGDRDLLEMNPFRGIPIVTPADYVKGKA